MKTPNTWWLHVLVGVVLLSTGVLAWQSWVISTRENPTVILHRHISECAWIDDNEKQVMWQYMFSMDAKIKACCDVAEKAAELAKAANTYTEKFALYAAELLTRVEKNETDIQALEKRVTELEKKPKQHRHGCGEW